MLPFPRMEIQSSGSFLMMSVFDYLLLEMVFMAYTTNVSRIIFCSFILRSLPCFGIPTQAHYLTPGTSHFGHSSPVGELSSGLSIWIVQLVLRHGYPWILCGRLELPKLLFLVFVFFFSRFILRWILLTPPSRHFLPLCKYNPLITLLSRYGCS